MAAATNCKPSGTLSASRGVRQSWKAAWHDLQQLRRRAATSDCPQPAHGRSSRQLLRLRVAEAADPVTASVVGRNIVFIAEENEVCTMLKHNYTVLVQLSTSITSLADKPGGLALHAG